MSKIIFFVTLLAIILQVLSTTCKDGSSCPGNTTCCMSPQGTVGCCPYENASCCSDGLHCCPNGYTCDLAKGQCTKGTDSFLAFVSLKATSSSPAKTFTPPSINTLKGFPKIEDLLKCAEDIKPVATDLLKAYTEYKKGTSEGKSNARELLLQIAEEAGVMGTDCWKVIQEILE